MGIFAGQDMGRNFHEGLIHKSKLQSPARRSRDGRWAFRTFRTKSRPKASAIAVGGCASRPRAERPRRGRRRTRHGLVWFQSLASSRGAAVLGRRLVVMMV